MGNHTLNQANKQEAKVALVTGGARRIGAAIVKTLHHAGFRVVIHCHNSLQEAHELAAELNHKRLDSAFVLARELNHPDSASEIMESLIDWAGRLDLLVNNASVFIRSEDCSFKEQDWDALFDINVKAPYQLSCAARGFLSKQQGAIINISDIHARKPLKGYAIYCQTKAALDMQTKVFAREFAPHIRVNAVAPGSIAWPEHANALSDEDQKKIIERTALKRHGDPKFIAQAVLSLAENSFVTGQILEVDGGRGLF